MLNNDRYSADIKTRLAEKGLDAGSEYWLRRLDQVDNTEVESALTNPAGTYNFERLLTLISPAAEDYLEDMAQQVQAQSP